MSTTEHMARLRRARMREDIACYVSRHPCVSHADIHQHLLDLSYEVSSNQLSHELRHLRRAGEIRMEGATKNATYHPMLTHPVLVSRRMDQVAAFCDKHGLGVAAAFELLQMLEGK